MDEIDGKAGDIDANRGMGRRPRERAPSGQAWVGGSGLEVTYRVQSDRSRKRQRRPTRGALRDDRAGPSSRPGPGSGTAMRPSLTLPALMFATGRRTGSQGPDPGRIQSGRFRPWDRFPTCLSGSPPGEGLLNGPKYGPRISFQGVKPRRSRSRVTRCNLAAGPARRPHPRHLRPGGPTAGPARPAGFVDRFRGARGRHWPWWDGRQTR